MEKIEKLKKFLQENYPNIQAFDTRNFMGDPVETVYIEDGIQVDYCAYYEYIEIFGLTDKEFESLIKKGSYRNLKTFRKYVKKDKDK